MFLRLMSQTLFAQLLTTGIYILHLDGNLSSDILEETQQIDGADSLQSRLIIVLGQANDGRDTLYLLWKA
jgi:hypothetical protein